ncbi:N-acetyl-alpha-D-glucosaminyl L-malate synthase [bioreactor metagenome]|jgi:L-malate glycosyltransferase|uniref:N-acetyl-alpha-D-glucosaminyl L-malate synthase n=1 Tax=bioreactor metagenome TaxID=1076179 RepID=A0A644WLN7_9ZZZZ
MKICYLSDINSYHTHKWCRYFISKGHEVHVITLNNGTLSGVNVHSLDLNSNLSKKDSSFYKLSYLKRINRIKDIVNQVKPDILHAHYASSYGLLGALCNYHPYILSLWGSDILLFPKEGLVQKNIIKYNLKKADKILSTSRYMRDEANIYTKKDIDITPFGIDVELFRNREIRKNDEIIIGIVKSLEKIYGIEYLIQAFSNIIKKYPEKGIRLEIVGEGTQKNSLKNLVHKLNVEESVKFLGSMTQEKVADFYNKIHIAVFPSISESFGVSVLEAQACGVPVIVSDIKAFEETTIIGESSLVCKVKNSKSIEFELEKLLLDKKLREDMGNVGSIFVRDNFNQNNIFIEIEDLYKSIKK